MEPSASQRIIESLNQDFEEKTYQMSQIRLVAEAMAEGLHDPNYFHKKCSDFIYIFEAAISGVFWDRKREPSGWFLDAWACRDDEYNPTTDIIHHGEGGVLNWAKHHNKPLYLENLTDEAILKIWETDSLDSKSIMIIPLQMNGVRSGILIVIDPVLKLSPPNIQRHLDIIFSLINSGIRNRLFYKSLQNSEEEFRDLFEFSSDMIIVVYPDGVIRDCNRALIETLGLTTDPRGHQISEFLTEEKGQNFKDCWKRLLRGEAVRNVDITLKREGVGTIVTELSGNVRTLPDGRPGIVRLNLRDLTERRDFDRQRRELELEIELGRQQQLAQVGMHVSGIVHNLQNPLQVLLGYIEMAKVKGLEIPKFSVIEQAVQSIVNIVRNLLLKMLKQSNSEFTLININELLENELTFLNANPFFKHNIEKEYQFTDRMPLVHGIYSDFSQVITNIVHNALDAMINSPKKFLKVSTEVDDAKGLISINISDTGSGIPERVKDKIFQPFFSTKEDQKESYNGISSGSGLGLSSSVALLETYGGEISFETYPNQGTTFKIDIPTNGHKTND